MNPIIKTKTRGGAFTSAGYRPSYGWAYVCPHCPDASPVLANLSARHSSRKTAKDALHRHILKDHAAPR